MFNYSIHIPHHFRLSVDRLDDGLNRSSSELHNDQTFYRSFLKDLRAAKREVVICSPFITKYRFLFFQKTLRELKRRNVTVFIFTRAIADQEFGRRREVRSTLDDFEATGAIIIQLPGAVHEKIAIIDREILWEGSLNILSQRESRELMRRTISGSAALQVMAYLQITSTVTDGYRLRSELLCHSLVDRLNRTPARRRFIWAVGIVVVVAGWWLLIRQTGTMEPVRTAWNIIRLLNMPIR